MRRVRFYNRRRLRTQVPLRNRLADRQSRTFRRSPVERYHRRVLSGCSSFSEREPVRSDRSDRNPGRGPNDFRRCDRDNSGPRQRSSMAQEGMSIRCCGSEGQSVSYRECSTIALRLKNITIAYTLSRSGCRAGKLSLLSPSPRGS